MEGVRAVWVLLALVAGVFAAPPTPTGESAAQYTSPAL
ncbi:hypothetical protein E2C01_072250 [Portunus trituberculatus]|uniref:Uncharacterized protein n=1 Tax=Portunus trituberculatus TaxID=210409 RepID=A0A5B7IAQ5_PORTR|nr:hypothetical protein [Portunus trituberculatus]